MANLNHVPWVAAFVTCSVRFATTTEPQADLCSLLPAAVLSKLLGQTYPPTEKHVAPRPYENTAEGQDCTYPAKSDKLLFRVYVDPSSAVSAELFAGLKNLFGRESTSIAGIGDEAYLDAHRGLHARKGKVRFFISAKAASGKQLRDLASGVVGQL
jgi:hypothetical protein